MILQRPPRTGSLIRIAAARLVLHAPTLPTGPRHERWPVRAGQAPEDVFTAMPQEHQAELDPSKPPESPTKFVFAEEHAR